MTRTAGWWAMVLGTWAWTGAALGAPLDTVPMLFQATSVNQGGVSTPVLVPRPLDRIDPTRGAEAVLAAFDLLKKGAPEEYGQASLSLGADFPKTLQVTLVLDPARKGHYDRVAGEVFYTLRSLGVRSLLAPAIQPAPLDPSAIRVPVFALVVSWVDALPPRKVPDALVQVSPQEVLPGEVFAQRIAQGDRALMDRVLGGLRDSREAVRLGVLAAMPHLPVDRRADRLLALLDDPSPGIRLAVLKMLEGESDPKVPERLGRLVETDTDQAVRLAAVRLLAARGVHKYDVLLEMEAIQDSREDVVIPALDRLARSGNATVAPAIAAALKAPGPRVREAARNALLGLKAWETLAALLSDEAVDLPTREAFANRLAEEAPADLRVRGLAWLLARGSPASAARAAGSLAAIRSAQASALLLEALSRKEPEVREAVFRALGSIRDPALLGRILAAPTSPQEKVLAEEIAVQVLGSLPLDALMGRLEDPDATVRRLAMRALSDALGGSPPPPRAVALLQGRLQDPDVGIRRAAAQALARVSDERGAASLLSLANDTDPELRAAAMTAASRAPGADAEAVLLKGLVDESDLVRRVAVQGVAGRRIPAARDALQRLGSYRDPQIRRLAVQAWIDLLQPGEGAANFPFLSSLLYDKDPGVRILALRVVAGIPERRALMAVSSLVIDPDRSVRLAALEALAGTGEKDALEGLLKGVFDEDPEVRLAALEGIRRLGRPEAVDFLNELIAQESDPAIKARAEAVRSHLLSR